EMDWSASVLSYLASVTARSLVLFAPALAAMLAFRVKSAAARHALLTMVAGGMLVLAALSPALPPMPVRVLKAHADAAAPLPDLSPIPAIGSIPAGRPVFPPARGLAWQDVAVAGYLLGAFLLLVRLAYGYHFTRRLVRAASPIHGLDH